MTLIVHRTWAFAFVRKPGGAPHEKARNHEGKDLMPGSEAHEPQVLKPFGRQGSS